jgi:uncharacterized metal-binding protein
VCPLLAAALLDKSATMLGVCTALVQVFLGVSAGLCASTFFTASGRDITAQCSATLAALGIILLPYIPWLAHQGTATQQTLRLALAGALLAATYLIERKRNAYYWRARRVTSF